MMWLIIFVLSVIFSYFKLYKPHQYWKERNVPHIKPYPIVGNMLNLITRWKPMTEDIINFYNNSGENRYMGTYLFLKPTLYIKDIDLIKQIYIKDFDHFVDRNLLINEDIEPLFGRSLFFLQGQRWRDMRAILSPAFTGSKMRSMFVLITECAESVVKYYEKNADPTKPTAVEMKDLTTRYGTDVIASCAFGIKCDSLEEKNNEFFVMAKQTSFNNGNTLRGFKIVGLLMSTSLMKFLNIKLFTEDENNYYRNLVTSMMKTREKEGIIRPDMIHLLMEAKKGKLKHEETVKSNDTGFATVEESTIGKDNKRNLGLELVDDDLTAQAVLFFAAGFDTSSTLLSFMAHELAVNEDIQRKLQEEIDEYMENTNGKLTYDNILQMKYLDMVVCETLRMWPPIMGNDRKCIKPYTVVPVKPNEKQFVIEKNMVVWISFYAMHMNPIYFPDPYRFDPERFSDENKKNIVPFSYLPFGIGPRNCIGSRFALLATKAFFAYLLAKFDIVVVKETQVPLKLNNSAIGLDAANGFWVGLKLRTK